MNKKSLLIGLLSFVSSVALAGTVGEVKPIPSWSPFVGLSVGPSWAHNGRTQSIFFAPDFERIYAADKANHSLVKGELFLGFQHLLMDKIQAQLGIAGALVSYARFFGTIWDAEDLQFTNHVYHYQVRQSQIAVKGRLLADVDLLVTPWVSGSVGVGFNQTNNFSSSTRFVEAIDSPRFHAHTNTAFTYALGVGIQRQVINHWQVGLGFEFADWGKSQLNKAIGQTFGKRGLTLDHLYTNGIMLNMTYIA